MSIKRYLYCFKFHATFLEWKEKQGTYRLNDIFFCFLFHSNFIVINSTLLFQNGKENKNFSFHSNFIVLNSALLSQDGTENQKYVV